MSIFLYGLCSILVKIAIEVNRAVLFDMIMPALELTDGVEVVIGEADPNNF